MILVSNSQISRHWIAEKRVDVKTVIKKRRGTLIIGLGRIRANDE